MSTVWATDHVAVRFGTGKVAHALRLTPPQDGAPAGLRRADRTMCGAHGTMQVVDEPLRPCLACERRMGAASVS